MSGERSLAPEHTVKERRKIKTLSKNHTHDHRIVKNNEDIERWTCLARHLLGAALAVGVCLFGDPLAALVGIRERMPWLLVEIGMAPSGAGFCLIIDLAVFTLIGKSLAQPYSSVFLPLYSFFHFCLFDVATSVPELVLDLISASTIIFSLVSFFL